MIKIFLLGLALHAAESARESELGPIEVFGASQDHLERPLDPIKVNQKKIEAYQYTDVNRALKNVSGAYSREEDGHGLRPNIGLRGTSPDRSKKVVLMEDGILTGPAPYSAPAAYYTPSMTHVESLEVFKGFSAVPYGPNSIGGAVNYVSTSIPFERKRELSATYGQFNSLNLKGMAGGPVGSHEYLLQLSRITTDGFKKLERGTPTGFVENDILGKFDFKISETLRLAFTAGFADENSSETYVGLTQTDFESTPFRRYAASQKDRMKWTHSKLRARLTYQPSSTGTIETTLYRHDFHRSWYRLDAFRDTNVNLRGILNDPTGGNAPYFDILRGGVDSSSLGNDGQLNVVDNDRTYYSHGLQTKFGWDVEAGQHRHGFEFQVRFHQDGISRNHTSDFYEMTTQQMHRTAAPTQTSLKNKDEASAWTLSFLDNWRWRRLTLTPAVRFETVDFKNTDLLTGNQRSRTDSFWVPGLSLTVKISEQVSIRISQNAAATASGLATDGSEMRESSNNYETEIRYQDPSRNQQLSLLYFESDYRNLTGTCTVSTGCTASQTDVQFNGGQAKISGVEFDAAKGFHLGAVYLPLQLNVTLLRARFASNFTSTSQEWGLGQIRAGDPLPYVPEARYTVSIGSEYKRFKQDFSFVYQSKVYDQSAAAGRIEVLGYGVIDWAGSYQLSKTSRIFAKADNILGREYSVSARPFGLRPGKPRGIYVGWIQGF